MSAPQGYTVEPPSYDTPASKKAYGTVNNASTNAASEPLLGGGSAYASGSAAPRNDWTDEGESGDVPEDFKIGTTVSQSSADVRSAFVRKVYAVLFTQLLATAAVGWSMMHFQAASWVQAHSGLMLIPMFGAIAAMIGVFVKRHSHPLNLILLSVFTIFEAVTLGSVVCFFDQTIVLQALVITTFLFLGLTLFTLQSKYDFDGMGPYLFGALLAFFLTSLVGLFLPYSRTMDMVLAGFGTLLFSAYIVYDTHMLMRRLHVDDWVFACVSLYLDFINLFLQILRLLSDIQDR